MTSPYHDLIGGFAECRQDQDGLSGDGPYLLGALVFSLYPAMPLRKLFIFDYYDELPLLEAEERGVICRRTGDAQMSRDEQKRP